jgi:hypothetical protein
MNTLREEIYVNCPVNQARRHLEAFFREHQMITLRVPMVIPGLKMGVLVQRDVRATVRQIRAASDAFDTLSVSWEAVGGGPFPRFEGTIDVKADEDYESFRLVLHGRYDPPLGMAGEAFDAVVGRWVAIAAVRDLLGQIRDAVEASYRALEAGKSAHAVGAPR